MSKLVIAIDGPAGAGKSTVAKAIARRLGLHYLDTGAMYRALALKVQRAAMSPDDCDRATRLAAATVIEFAPGDPQRVLLDGEDVTDGIRTLEIGELASAISACSGVRTELVARQRAMVSLGGVTLEGRDATTVIAPNADVKVYMTASLEERARRRHDEAGDVSGPGGFEQVRSQIEQRDHRDITREDSPLSVAPGATIVETGGLTIAEVVERVLALVPDPNK